VFGKLVAHKGVAPLSSSPTACAVVSSDFSEYVRGYLYLLEE
jgi:hypothetical protein